MNKLITKVVGVALGLGLATGVAAGVALGNRETFQVNAYDAGDNPAASEINNWKAITSLDDISTSGRYLIGATSGGTKYWATGSLTTGNTKGIAVTSTFSNAVIYSLTANGNYYALTPSSGNYITHSSGTGLGTATTTTNSSWTFNLSGGFLYIESTNAPSGGVNRQLALNGTSDLRAYAASGTNVKSTLFKYDDSSSFTPATNISINESISSLSVGTSTKLTTTLTPSNPTDDSVSWISGNFDILRVGDDGTVTAVGEGTTTITANANGAATANSVQDNITISSNVGNSFDYCDVLNGTLFGVAGTTYTSWNSKSATNDSASNAIYDGKTAYNTTNKSIALNNDSGNGIIVSTSDGLIKKVLVIWGDGTTSGRVLNIHGSNNAPSLSSLGNVTETIVCGTSTEATLNSGNGYHYLALNSNSGALYLASILIYWDDDSAASVSLNKTEVSLFTNQSSGIDVTATVFNVNSPTYSWVSNNANVSLENANTATVTIKPNTNSSSTSTVTLTVGGVSPALTATVNVTLKVAGPGETLETAYSVAEAIAEIDKDQSITINNVYVEGIISQIDSYNSSYHSITYWISDDGTTASQFEVYGGKNLNNTNFNSVNDVKLQAEVVIYGNIKYYSGTYEFAANNYLVSYTAPVVAEKTVFDINFACSASTTAFTSATWASAVGGSGDGSDLTFLTGSDFAKVYPEDNYIKFGSSSAVGLLTLKTLNSLKIKRVIVCAKSFVSTSDVVDANAAIVVNGSTAVSTTEDWKYYTFDLSTASDQIAIKGNSTSNGRFYIKDIIFVGNDNQAAIGAYGYAAEFLNALDEECAALAVTSTTWGNLGSAWATMETNYAGSQTFLLAKTPSESGNVIQQALARYDFIVGKYTSYTNFMNRGTNSANRLNDVSFDNSAVMTFVIIAIVLTTSTGAIFLLRKKKEER